MRPVKITMNAAGYSQWVPIDYIESWFGIGVGVILSEDGNLTYGVQYTFDEFTADVQGLVSIAIARSGTTATVTDAGQYGIGHGLSVGDSVIVSGTGSTQLDSQAPTWGTGGPLGWNVASTPSPTSYTYTCANAGPAADQGVTRVIRLRVFTSTLTAQTTRGTVTFNYPVRAVRLYVSSYTAGFADMIVLQGMAT
jgi:hypothetical protein